MGRKTEFVSTGMPPTAPRQCSVLGAILGTVVGLAYYGFLAAGAVMPQLLAKPAVAGVPWSFLLGAALLVLIVCATGIYTLVANAAEERS